MVKLKQPRPFNPERVANLEAEGWRAYYDRRWLHVFRLITRLNQEEFGIPFPKSLAAAYYVARATRAWAPIEHDETKVERYLAAFYRLACKYARLRADPATAARLEAKYWEVHRRLIPEPDKTEFVEALVALHSALFDLSPEAALLSAQQRVEASNVVDRIVLKQSQNEASDWKLLEKLLHDCYSSIASDLTAGTLVGATA